MSFARFSGGLAPVVLVISALGCSSRTPVAAPSFSPGPAARAAMDEFDTNKDGNLDAQELEKSPGLKAAIGSIDKDSNGQLSEEEIKARIEFFRQTSAALIPFGYRISLGGQPLTDAQVRLVPEPFMASAIKPASGTTDAHGAVSLAVTGLEYRGVQLGVYRVEVSKKDAAGNEQVPAKFNSQTILGQQVATDVREMEGEVRLDLVGN